MGHARGDQVLQDIAGMIGENIRLYDIAARYGGDEFVIVFPGTRLSTAEELMHRLVKSAETMLSSFEHLGVSLNWGISDSLNKSLEEILELADSLMYKSSSDRD